MAGKTPVLIDRPATKSQAKFLVECILWDWKESSWSPNKLTLDTLPVFACIHIYQYVDQPESRTEWLPSYRQEFLVEKWEVFSVFFV